MKTAISVSDPVFERVERHAQRLGISRSEFFATAAARWADELEEGELTAAIDDAIDAAGPDDTAAFSRQAAKRLLASEPPSSGPPDRGDDPAG